MKVLIVNTSEKIGGAAIAAKRLTKALNSCNVEAGMLVRDKQTDDNNVTPLGASIRKKWQFIWERLTIWLHNGLNKKRLFQVSIANTGTDITKLKEFREADIIHLHWINQGMLSLKDIEKILHSGKPVVWTMHDMWPCTGICHHARECDRFHKECCLCPYLCNRGGGKDLSTTVFNKKRRLYKLFPITFVTCSKWLKDRAKKSSLLEKHDVVDIPNPIDTTLFKPGEKSKARQRLKLPLGKKLVLFGAVKITDKRKGIDYFIESCNILAKKYPDSKDYLGIVACGNGAEELKSLLPFEVYPLNYISNENELVDVYNAVDAFVTPSLEENLPNTIMEALACGVPCVGFKIGGVPEMIEHKVNGYVSKYRCPEDFADGIHWVLNESQYEDLKKAAVEKVEKCYSQRGVAEKYIHIYKRLTKF